MQLDINSYVLLAVLTFLNLVLSVGILEIILRLQNSINSLIWLEIARKSLLVIFGGLMFALFMSIKSFASEASSIEQGNCVLIYLAVILYYLFKYFFPRQKYINTEDKGQDRVDKGSE